MTTLRVQAACRIRYWLEFKPKKGWRFCTQTTNPKVSYEKWNAPKCSTYVEFGACMFLSDSPGEEGHVKWTGVGGYAKAADVLQFVEEFPGADMRVIRLLAGSARQAGRAPRQARVGPGPAEHDHQRRPRREE